MVIAVPSICKLTPFTQSSDGDAVQISLCSVLHSMEAESWSCASENQVGVRESALICTGQKSSKRICQH